MSEILSKFAIKLKGISLDQDLMFLLEKCETNLEDEIIS